MENPQLPPDFVEFIRLSNEHAVEYLVIGGYAVAVHGYVRTTGDLDIWVRSTRKNADRVVRVLKSFGFGVADLGSELFLNPDKVVRLGVPPVQIEIFTTIKGVEFEQAYSNRLSVAVHGTDVDVIGFDDLISAKRAAGRHIDLHDVEQLLGE